MGGSNDFYKYNPITDTWTRKADFPGFARYSSTGFTIGTKGYVAVGWGPVNQSAVATKELWEYNPLNDAWTRKAEFGGVAMYSASGFSLGNKGYIGLGASAPDNVKTDFWEYKSFSNSWVQIGFAPGLAALGVNGFSIGTKGYFACGSVDYFNYVRQVKDLWEFTPGDYLRKWSTGEITPSIKVKTAGNYSATVTNDSTGCSATSPPVAITVKPFSTSLTEVNLLANGCGASYNRNGNIYTSPGIYRKPGFINSVGCDSTAILKLAIRETPDFTIKTSPSTSVCAGNFLQLTAYKNGPTNLWKAKASFPASADAFVGFGIGAKGYAITGGGSKDFWELAPLLTHGHKRQVLPDRPAR